MGAISAEDMEKLSADIQTQSILVQEAVRDAARQVIHQREVDAVNTAVDSANIVAAKQVQDAQTADGYAASIRQIEGKIQSKQAELGIDQRRLGETLSDAVQSSQDAMAVDIENADVAARRQMVKDAVKLGFAVGLAALAAPFTGGLSLVVAGGYVASQYLSNDANNGRIADAVLALGSDVFNYFKCSKTAIHVYDSINAHLSSVNDGLSNAGLGTLDAYDIGSCDLDHLDCGHLDEEACDADKNEVRSALTHLNDLRGFLANIGGLAALANTVLDPDADVSPEDLPRVALMRSTLGSIDASVTVSLFTKAAMLGDVATDVPQLVELIEAKLDMLTNFYKAKLDWQVATVTTNIFAAQAARAQALATASGDSEEETVALAEYFEGTILQNCFVALVYLVQQTQAFQFMSLQKDSGIDQLLVKLRQERQEPAAYKTLVMDAHNELLTKWQAVLGESNNCGGETWGSVDFELAQMPGNSFAADGTLTVDIGIPPHNGYSHVTFSDAKVYLVGLSISTPVTVELVKAGSSKMLDSEGSVWEFTHMKTTPPFNFGYEPSTCGSTVTVAGASGSNLCLSTDSSSVYMKMSPHGVWNLAAIGVQRPDLATVTAIRFAFKLSVVPLRVPDPDWDGITLFAGVPSLGTVTTEAGASECGANCGADCGNPARPTPTPPTPPPTPPTPPPPPTPQVAVPDCMEMLFSISGAMNTACCADEALDCPNGSPTECDDTCASILTPYFKVCNRGDPPPWHTGFSDRLLSR